MVQLHVETMVCPPRGEWGIDAVGSLQALFLHWCPEKIISSVHERRGVGEGGAHKASAIAWASTLDFEEEDDDFEVSGVNFPAILSRRLFVCKQK